jgi:hypothetical protein
MNQHVNDSDNTVHSSHTWRQSAEAREEEVKAIAAQDRERKVNLKAFVMSIAVMFAPFFALLFGIDAALFVLALALFFTAWVAREASKRMAAAQRSKLRMAAMFNGVLGLVALVLLILRQFA